MTNKLWQLAEEIERLENQINQEAEANQEEALSLFTEWLEQSQDFNDSALKLAGYIRYLETLAEARKKESARLSKLSQEASNRAKGLREYIAWAMLRLNKSKLEGVTGKISLRTNPRKVVVVADVESIPAHLCRIQVDPNIEEIRRLLMENSEEVANIATFGEPTYSITIK